MTKQEIVNKVLEHYELEVTYVDCKYKGMEVKFRINKNHSRNHARNDDHYSHNLSLINVYGNGFQEVDSYFTNEVEPDRFIDHDETITYIQKQVWGVMDKEDVEKEVIEFLEQIDSEN